MELDELLNVMDCAAANLAKLQTIWDRAEPMMPSGPSRSSNTEYEDLRRAWSALSSGLSNVDGSTVTSELRDIDEVGRAFIDYFEISEPAFELSSHLEQPGHDLERQ